MTRSTLLLPIVLCCAALAAQQPRIPDDGTDLVKTPSGLSYSVLGKGQGEEHPRPGDRVRFHYMAWLTDGTLVESSLLREKPLDRILGVAMCKAWTEAIQRMRKGTRCKVVAPPELAYGKVGSKGNPPAVPPVPPDATLVFEIELFSFERCIDLPVYRLPDLAKQKTTKGGVRYWIADAGAGRLPKEGEGFEVEVSTFNARGELLSTSRDPNIPSVFGRIGDEIDGPEFLTEAVPLLPLGGAVQFEIPAKMYGSDDGGFLLPKGSSTTWVLRLLRLEPPREIPEFRRLTRGKASRTKSGLRYEVLDEGRGARPGPSARVVVHYAGWNSRGELFDNSMRRGVPLSFTLDDPKVLQGWAEGIALMRVGAVFRFSIPGRLGYGLKGRKDRGIGPNETLHFHLELVGFEDSRP